MRHITFAQIRNAVVLYRADDRLFVNTHVYGLGGLSGYGTAQPDDGGLMPKRIDYYDDPNAP